MRYSGPWLAALPWYAAMVVFFALPIAWLAALSLTGTGPNGGVAFPSLENFRAIFDLGSGDLEVLGRTIVTGLEVVLLSMIIAVPVGYYLAKILRSPRVEAIILTLIAGTFLLGPLVRTVSWRGILGFNGLINAALTGLGVIQEPLLSLLYGRPAMVLAMTYNDFPFMLFTMYLALKMVDDRYIAAARDLGASASTAFWRIVLPLAAPGLFTGAVLVSVPTLSAVLEPEMLGGTSGRLAATAIRDQFFHANNWPKGAALTVTLVLGGAIAIALLIACVSLFLRASARLGIALGNVRSNP
jgi:ABC-type spermidine/putrescine transport system permease subunit I